MSVHLHHRLSRLVCNFHGLQRVPAWLSKLQRLQTLDMGLNYRIPIAVLDVSANLLDHRAAL